MDTPELEVRFTHEFLDSSGKIRITVNAGETVFTDEFKLTTERGRTRFAGKVCERFGALDEAAVKDRLDAILREFEAWRARDAEQRESSSDDSKELSGSLVDLALGQLKVELFHTPGSADCQPYARVPVKDHFEHQLITSRTFKLWLAHQHYTLLKSVPSANALTDAVNTLAGHAVFDGAEHPVCVRLGGDDETIFVDLGRPDFQLVKITAAGWELVQAADAPVRFVRREGLLELPQPIRGGSLTPLRGFLNVPDEASWVLLLGFLVMCFRPTGPYPILVVNGEQGSAKSTMCRIVRAIVDPNVAPLRRPPKDVRDIVIAARNSRLLTYDNLSGLSASLADTLCSLATGGGFATRRLYSDDEETLFNSQRPIIVNGIEDLATRPDVLDRSLVLRLRAIHEGNRLEEKELLAQFEQELPSILGALFDAVSMAMRRLSSVRTIRLPRMADFMKWSLAAEPALPIDAGAFEWAMDENTASIHADVLSLSPVGRAVQQLMHTLTMFEGSATELLNVLNARRRKSDEPQTDWPKSAPALGTMLSRLAPSLRASGLVVELNGRRPGSGRDRFLRISRPERMASPSRAATAEEGAGPVASSDIDGSAHDPIERGDDESAGDDWGSV